MKYNITTLNTETKFFNLLSQTNETDEAVSVVSCYLNFFGSCRGRMVDDLQLPVQSVPITTKSKVVGLGQ
jgi:hypothetical protein